MIEEQKLYTLIQSMVEGAPQVNRDTEFISDLHFDSMMSIFLITTIEDMLDIDIPMDKILSFTTCGELFDAIKTIKD